MVICQDDFDTHGTILESPITAGGRSGAWQFLRTRQVQVTPREDHSHFLGKVHLGKSSFWGRKTLILLGENPNWDGDNPQEQVIRGFPGNEGVLFLQRSQSLPDGIFGQL